MKIYVLQYDWGYEGKELIFVTSKESDIQKWMEENSAKDCELIMTVWKNGVLIDTVKYKAEPTWILI